MQPTPDRETSREAKRMRLDEFVSTATSPSIEGGVCPPPESMMRTSMDEAAAYMALTFGPEWRSAVHASHRPSLAEPVLYCRVCGKYSERAGSIRGLGERCQGDPTKHGDTRKERGGGYATKLRRLREGLHPVDDRRVRAAAPLPLGTKR